MESSSASAEVKGSTQAEERETEKKGWRGGRQSQTTREDKHAEHVTQIQKTRMVRGGCSVTCPRCCCGEPARAGRHCGLESRLQVEEVALHLHCAAEEKGTSSED